MLHPSAALFEGEAAPASLPVCDHYAGSEKLMRKSLALQQELGPVFDITLDCEDGAAVGAEEAHARLAAGLINSDENSYGRVGVRAHDTGHAAFRQDVDILVSTAGAHMAFLVLPKVRGADEVREAIDLVNATAKAAGIARRIPVHVLIETHSALREAHDIAALPQVECLSFGLMDFVSAHHGAIPASAMGPDQFSHPLIARAMLEIAAACHAHGKVPSHNVTTNISDPSVAGDDARHARLEFGYTRKWSIHPSQIKPIVAAFAPASEEIAEAGDILAAAQHAGWGPIRHADKLHDRASYRYYWSVLRRAHATGAAMPDGLRTRFFGQPVLQAVPQ
ncbi:MAG: CoA ester lyase [Candidatus Protistobacter heckmanni]|nr:CoA ester lyase [Candidatus Protistobacter heckmanni]